MALSGDDELLEIMTALGRSPVGVFGVRIEALAQQAFITEFNFDSLVLNETRYQLSDSAAAKIFNAFGTHYGLDLTNAFAIRIDVFRGSDVQIEARFTTPADLTDVNWANVFSA